MGTALRTVVWLLSRLMVSLRYRVTVHEFEQIRNLKGAVLLLPNSPNRIDPVLILATFDRDLHLKTVLF
jgi:1-acyl-sn-glycerol-3-phosphate acyltransferase